MSRAPCRSPNPEAGLLVVLRGGRARATGCREVVCVAAGNLAPSGRQSVVVNNDVSRRAVSPGVEALLITQGREPLDDLEQYALHQIVNVGLICGRAG